MNKLIFSCVLIVAYSSPSLIHSGSDDERAITKSDEKSKATYHDENLMDEHELEYFSALFSKPLAELKADMQKRIDEDFVQLNKEIEKNKRQFKDNLFKHLVKNNYNIELQKNLSEFNKEELDLLKEKIKAKEKNPKILAMLNRIDI